MKKQVMQPTGAFVLQGDICYAPSPKKIVSLPQGYLVCQQGKCLGAFARLPQAYEAWPRYDYRGKLIIPGLVDLHLHAPQHVFRGLGMDLELLDWLNTHTFVEEAKYAQLEYARQAYTIFAEDLLASPTTRACIFATIHKEATLLLMDLLEQGGFHGYVGKVNMDRNSPPNLCESSAEASLAATEEWLEESTVFKNVRPMLTPRFIPSCTPQLLQGLGRLQARYQLPLQSHLSENLGEISWVQELCPESSCYGDAYDRYGLFGSNGPTIMAHCVHSNEEERQLILERGVYIAHCPQSNTNLSSGIAPARLYLDQGFNLGLGTDVAGGESISMFRAMTMAIQCSKLRWRLVDQGLAPLRLEEVFYLATKGGGRFFGQVGSFEEGYELDALVIDDSSLRSASSLGLEERLARACYLLDARDIVAKFIAGRSVK